MTDEQRAGSVPIHIRGEDGAWAATDLDWSQQPEWWAGVEAGPGLKWGFGLLLNTQRQPAMRAAGSRAWAGLFNTHFWVDPASRVTGAIYTQTLPFAEPRAFQVYADFEQARYASLH
jgi:CubicO group peptidase (beta-lactamase class C family)